MTFPGKREGEGEDGKGQEDQMEKWVAVPKENGPGRRGELLNRERSWRLRWWGFALELGGYINPPLCAVLTIMVTS